MGRRGLLLAVLVAGLYSLAMPSTALSFPFGVGLFDETSSSSFMIINYRAPADQANNVNVKFDATSSSYIVTDSGVGAITDADGPGVGCEPNPIMANQFSCPDPNARPACWDPANPEYPPDARIVRRVHVQGSNGNDTMTLEDSVTADGVFLGGAGDDRINGHKCASFVRGGNGDDVLYGGDNTDLQFGEDGNDEIHPGLGNDYDVYGQAGATGGLGYDTVSYEERTDPAEFVSIDQSATLQGTAGTTTAPCKVGRGGPGFKEFDTIVDNPTEQFEVVIGTSGDDCIFGTRWAQTIRGGPGKDQISGGQGVDFVDYSDKTSAVTVSIGDDPTGGPGNDGVGNGTAADTEGDNIYSDMEAVIGGEGDDTLIGQDRTIAYYDSAGGYDSRSGQEGANTLDGRGGNDLLIGKQDADTFTGGQGTDIVTYADRTGSIKGTVGDELNDDGDETDVNSLTSRGDNIDGTVEKVIGGSGNDVLRGNGLDNLLDGGGGNDKVNGGGGSDDLRGGDGNDVLEGAGDNDSLAGETGNDALEGGEGNDDLKGGDGDDLLDGNTGADSIDGGLGGDAADYTDRLGPVAASADGAGGDGEAGEGDNIASNVEDLLGGTDDDVLIGNGDLGFLDGGGGDDLLDGGGGPDILTGGAGADRVTYASRSAPVTIDLTNPGGDGEAGEDDDIADDVEKVSGGAGNDTFLGNGAANIFNGGEGVDTIDGGGGFDLLHGDGGDDNINGAGGTDQIFGDGGTDTLLGGIENDTLSGGGGDDSLDGGTGADILNGNEGSDTANYTARTTALSIVLDGAPNDGQSNENDLVKADVENVSTGSGNDTINSADGLVGKVSCGRGDDTVDAMDASDTISDDCETINVGALATCQISRSATVSGGGVVSIRVTCPEAGKATVTVRQGGKRVGRKSFSAREGKRKSVKVKLSRKARRTLRKNKRLRLSVTVSAIRSGKVKMTESSTRGITIRASRSK